VKAESGKKGIITEESLYVVAGNAFEVFIEVALVRLSCLS